MRYQRPSHACSGPRAWACATCLIHPVGPKWWTTTAVTTITARPSSHQPAIHASTGTRRADSSARRSPNGTDPACSSVATHAYLVILQPVQTFSYRAFTFSDVSPRPAGGIPSAVRRLTIAGSLLVLALGLALPAAGARSQARTYLSAAQKGGAGGPGPLWGENPNWVNKQ